MSTPPPRREPEARTGKGRGNHGCPDHAAGDGQRHEQPAKPLSAATPVRGTGDARCLDPRTARAESPVLRSPTRAYQTDDASITDPLAASYAVRQQRRCPRRRSGTPPHHAHLTMRPPYQWRLAAVGALQRTRRSLAARSEAVILESSAPIRELRSGLLPVAGRRRPQCSQTTLDLAVRWRTAPHLLQPLTRLGHPHQHRPPHRVWA